MTTADRIRNRRIELGLTQLDVAKRLGLTSKAAVCKVEKQGNDVTLKNVEKFALALHCAPAYLMGWSDEKYDGPEYEDYHLTANKRVMTARIIADYSGEFNNVNISDQEQEFLSLYSQLEPEQKSLVRNMMTAFLKKQ